MWYILGAGSQTAASCSDTTYGSDVEIAKIRRKGVFSQTCRRYAGENRSKRVA
jgi:hypothetical protein